MKDFILKDSMKPQKTIHKIMVFYDGECGLCHGLVKIILTHAKNPSGFAFAPLGGKLFTKTLEKPYPENTVVVVFNKKTYTYLAAVGFILKHFRSCVLRGIGAIFFNFPQGLGRFFYLMMTSLRQYIFKKPDSFCPVVDDKFKQLFFL